MTTNVRPAWQTDDLDEEWVDDDGTQSISLTTPLPTLMHTPTADHRTCPDTAGTFLIREDMPAAAFLPKTPGKQLKKGGIKDFFSPLALERMFEPPSPPPPKSLALALTSAPAIPSRLSQAFTPNDGRSDSDTSAPVARGTPSLAPPLSLPKTRMPLEGPFTFTVPRQSARFPQAQSTPGNPYSAVNRPMTDPRLRLFQLQYDTFTRDHLSAMVDSIAVNTTSGASLEANASSPSPAQRFLSKLQQTPVSDDTPIRSVKRIKLSPPSEFYGEGAGAGAVVSRPWVPRVDYVGESQSLMQQIKQARDFSTISTSATTQTPITERSQLNPLLQVPPNDNRATLMPVAPERSRSATASSTAAPSGHSSLAIRQQAESLMQQIKNDMRGSKRLFSGETELVPYTIAEDERSDLSASMHEKSQQSTASGGSHERSRRKSPKAVSPRRPSSSSRRQPSPRKFSRSVSDERERSLVYEMSNMSIDAPWQGEARPAMTPAPNPTIPHIRITSSPVIEALSQPPIQIPRSYPSSSLRSGNNDDLNRFVSSSTASGTTITASSAPSFVKHAGPVHITHITPSDVPSLPQRVGKMVYDRDLMKWMKASTRMVSDGDDMKDHTSVTDPESEDPFNDIESLREDDSRGMNESVGIAAEVPVSTEHEAEAEEIHFKQDMTQIAEGEEDDANDPEEVDLTSFSFGGRAETGVAALREEGAGDDLTVSDLEEDERAGTTSGPSRALAFESEDDLSNDSPEPQAATTVEATPSAPRRATAVATPMPPKSALKSTSATPVSAMKDPNRDKDRTPAQRMGHRRSVSFSDGKRDGPIRGLTAKPPESDDDVTNASSAQSAVYSPSARSKRIVEMMQDLEHTIESEESPTRASTPIHDVEELQLMGSGRPSSQMAVADASGSSRRVFSTSKRSDLSEQDRRNATFLTECSFGVAHDKLVQVITDVHPFEPHWEDLRTVDLSKKALDSVARLKEFLPKVDSLTLNGNQLAWLSGIPACLRTLSVASNLLTGVTSFGHLRNLENLDVSNNEIDSLTQLQCLAHLRELRADGNRITSLAGLEKLEGLRKLSVQGNLLREVDLRSVRWPRLEMLDMSQNRLVKLASLAPNIPSLVVLNLDGNLLDDLDAGGCMARLRILRASNNRLHSLNVGQFTNLRTLYLDNNGLGGLVRGERLAKLENLSMRNQSSRDFHLSSRQFRDVKRLYLSGNKLDANFITEGCYNLIYLEVAACRLTKLPNELARLVPNLRVLNLNYNFLEEATGLEGLTRLKKLTMIGSRLKGTKPLIRVLQRMPEVEMVDLRMNPSTLGWYLPLLVRDVPGALQPSENGGSGVRRRGEKGEACGWQELDAKFRRDLPDEVYVGRLVYRGLVMRACPRIRMLDGVEVSEKERAKANQLLQGIMGKGKIKGRRGEGSPDLEDGDRLCLHT